MPPNRDPQSVQVVAGGVVISLCFFLERQEGRGGFCMMVKYFKPRKESMLESETTMRRCLSLNETSPDACEGGSLLSCLVCRRWVVAIQSHP
jgi:hypothetical protein